MFRVRTFLGTEAVAFGVAALIHAGVLIAGYQHHEATIAESVIAGVLTLGLIVSALQPRSSRAVALGVQGFALLGTLVGIFTMVIGIGPQSHVDVALHVGFVALLISGLVIAAKGRPAVVTDA